MTAHNDALSYNKFHRIGRPRLFQVCSVNGCDRLPHARGVCTYHYERLHRPHANKHTRYVRAVLQEPPTIQWGTCLYCAQAALPTGHRDSWRDEGHAARASAE